MGEELEKEEVIIEKEKEGEEKELTLQELKALEKGWKPLEEWEGSEDEWVSAGEFNRRGELMGRIHQQNRQISDLQNSFDELAGHYKKVQETEFARAIEQLKSEKRQALEDEDLDKIIEIDEKIVDLKQSEKTPKEEQPKQSQVYTQWRGENDWYESDIELTAVADGIARAFITTKNGNTTETEVLNHVSKEVQRRYPEKFGKEEASPVASSARRTTRQQKREPKYSRKDLNDTQKMVMDRLVQSGVLTEEDYIKDLVSTGELG